MRKNKPINFCLIALSLLSVICLNASVFATDSFSKQVGLTGSINGCYYGNNLFNGVEYVFANQAAQTFTPTGSFTITSVVLKLMQDAPGDNITVSIKETDGSGHPTGDALCSVTVLAENITSVHTGLEPEGWTLDNCTEVLNVLANSVCPRCGYGYVANQWNMCGNATCRSDNATPLTTEDISGSYYLHECFMEEDPVYQEYYTDSPYYQTYASCNVTSAYEFVFSPSSDNTSGNLGIKQFFGTGHGVLLSKDVEYAIVVETSDPLESSYENWYMNRELNEGEILHQKFHEVHPSLIVWDMNLYNSYPDCEELHPMGSESEKGQALVYSGSGWEEPADMALTLWSSPIWDSSLTGGYTYPVGWCNNPEGYYYYPPHPGGTPGTEAGCWGYPSWKGKEMDFRFDIYGPDLLKTNEPDYLILQQIVILNGEMFSSASGDVRFEYGPTEDYGSLTPIQRISGGVFSDNLTNEIIYGGSTYYYRAIGTINGENITGSGVSFTTPSRVLELEECGDMRKWCSGVSSILCVNIFYSMKLCVPRISINPGMTYVLPGN